MAHISEIIQALKNAIGDCDREILQTEHNYPVGGYNPEDWGSQMTAEKYAELSDTSSLKEYRESLFFTLDRLGKEIDKAVDEVVSLLDKGDHHHRQIAERLKKNPWTLRI